MELQELQELTVLMDLQVQVVLMDLQVQVVLMDLLVQADQVELQEDKVIQDGVYKCKVKLKMNLNFQKKETKMVLHT